MLIVGETKLKGRAWNRGGSNEFVNPLGVASPPIYPRTGFSFPRLPTVPKVQVVCQLNLVCPGVLEN